MIYSRGPLSEAGFFLSSVKVVLFFLPQIQMPVWVLATLLRSMKAKDPGLGHMIAEHCWWTHTSITVFICRKHFHAELFWVECKSLHEVSALSRECQSFSAISEITQMWLWITFDFGAKCMAEDFEMLTFINGPRNFILWFALLNPRPTLVSHDTLRYRAFCCFPSTRGKKKYFPYLRSSDIITAVIEKKKDFYHGLGRVFYSWSSIWL